MKRDPTQNPYMAEDWYKQSLTIGAKSAVEKATKAAKDAETVKKQADSAVKQAVVNLSAA